MPMTKIIQEKSAGGIHHEYRVLPSILTNRGVFNRKQMFTLGAYGGPSQNSNPSKAEISSGPFPEFHTMHSDSFGDISSRHLKLLKILEEVFIYL